LGLSPSLQSSNQGVLSGAAPSLIPALAPFNPLPHMAYMIMQKVESFHGMAAFDLLFPGMKSFCIWPGEVGPQSQKRRGEDHRGYYRALCRNNVVRGQGSAAADSFRL
jgi:hypothetical protein